MDCGRSQPVSTAESDILYDNQPSPHNVKKKSNLWTEDRNIVLQEFEVLDEWMCVCKIRCPTYFSVQITSRSNWNYRCMHVSVCEQVREWERQRERLKLLVSAFFVARALSVGFLCQRREEKHRIGNSEQNRVHISIWSRVDRTNRCDDSLMLR